MAAESEVAGMLARLVAFDLVQWVQSEPSAQGVASRLVFDVARQAAA